MAVKLVGRSAKYKTAKQLREKIQAYFDSITRDYKMNTITGEDNDGLEIKEPVLSNDGKQVIETEWLKQPSIVGLCLFVGISRDTWNRYSKNPKFSDTIREATEIILAQKLDMLPRMKNPRGLMFDLSANYGMVEKKQVESNNTNLNYEMSEEEAEQILRQNGIKV